MNFDSEPACREGRSRPRPRRPGQGRRRYGFGAAAIIGVVALCGAPAAGLTASPPPECDARTRQGGLVLCRAAVPFGIVLAGAAAAWSEPERETDGTVRQLAVLGVSPDAPPLLTFRTRYLDGGVNAHTVEVKPRSDPPRRVGQMDCDRLDARTAAQKEHAQRSWRRKQEAFARFHPAAPGEKFAFVVPAPGRFTSPFGPERRYEGVSVRTGEACSKKSRHRGLDIGAPRGTILRAPMAGTVLLADPDLYYEGGCIFLDHGRGLVSVFMHLDSIDVTVGEKVVQGGRLGVTGMTGRASGPHLHWGVKWRDRSAAMDRSGDFYLDPELLPGIR